MPAQSILANPKFQSEKFLAAFTTEPLPRGTDAPWILPVGIFVISLFYSAVFGFLQDKLPGNRWRKGFTFGVIAWALMAPWFEFYLPWNVMREPFGLVLLEAVCWLGVMMGVGAGAAVTLPRKATGY
jgi:hypothetical protein